MVTRRYHRDPLGRFAAATGATHEPEGIRVTTRDHAGAAYTIEHQVDRRRPDVADVAVTPPLPTTGQAS